MDRVAKYKSECAGMTSSNQPGATGDGLDLVAAIGGRLIDMDQIQIHPSIFPRSHILISESLRGDGAILVNRAGRRFVNELETRDVVSAAILAQSGRTAFLLFDDGVRNGLKQIEGYFHLGLAREGRTPEELAQQMDVPREALAHTVTEYNRACSEKNDTAFHRDAQKLRPITGPEFYAIEVTPGVHYTMGGIQINADAQAMRTAGQPIRGLFAVGEVTGGVHGANRLGGNSISETITFGRIAGENAARHATSRTHAGGR
jgi:fumarate reductase flavoprotein subunit